VQRHPLGSLFIFRTFRQTFDNRIVRHPISQAETEGIELACHESVFHKIAPVYKGITSGM
jgi:hypothetical protein